MNYLFCFLLSACFLNGMDQSLQCKKDELEAIELAKISLHHFGKSPKNSELYRDLLYNAAKSQQHEFADFMLRRLLSNDTDQDLMPIIGKSFFVAASTGNLTYLSKIIAYVPQKGKSCALHCAAKNGNTDITQFLLEHGAQPESTGKQGKTALSLAIEHDQEAVAQLLLSKRVAVDGSVHQWSNPNGAAPHNCPDLVSWTTILPHGLKYLKLLLECGGNPNGSQDSQNKSPLLQCAKNNNYRALEMLLSFGAITNLKSENNPLFQAACRGHVESVELLASGVASEAIQTIYKQSSSLVWNNTYFQRLPLEIRAEVAKMRFTDPLAIKNALDVARSELEKDTIMAAEKKERLQKIIALLEAKNSMVSQGAITQPGQ